MSSLGRAASATVIGAAVVLADQLTKHWAQSSLNGRPGDGPTVFGGWLSLVLTTNSGAAFGVLAGQSLLALFAGILVLSLLIANWRLLTRRASLRIGIALTIGGALGNLADRIRMGQVIDFIHIRYWAVFNLADSAIVTGVALLAFNLLRAPGATPEVGKPHDVGDRSSP